LSNNQKYKSEYLKNIIILMTGTTASQLIPILVSPFLTRLYSPDDFGVLALFISITSILAVFASGKFDLAILLPKKNSEAIELVELAMVINFIVSVFLVMILLVFFNQITSLFPSIKSFDWLYFIPISVCAFTSYQIFSSYENRIKNYKRISISKVYQSLSTSFLNLSLALFKANYFGLIVSRLIGSIIALLTLKSISNITFKYDFNRLLIMAKRYKKFPIFSLPSDFLSVLTSELPIIMFVMMYRSEEVGLFALTIRVIGIPVGIVSGAISSVFRQEASSHYAIKENCKKIYISTAKTLFLVSIIPFMILGIFSPYLFVLIFGQEWRLAGDYTQLMSLMYFFKFTVSPLSFMYYIAEKQKEDMYLHFYVLLSGITAIYSGYHFYNDVYYSILFYSMNYVVIYIYTAIRSYTFAKGKT